VSRATLLLSVLITLRLLMPPGICVCKLSTPASRLLAAACGSELPAIPTEESDDDHDPGCPASYLSQGLGVAPPSGPGLIFLTLTGSVESILPVVHLVLPSDLLPTFSAPPSSPPLYVEQCALIC
jgi:hypothetical protein